MKKKQYLFIPIFVALFVFKNAATKEINDNSYQKVQLNRHINSNKYVGLQSIPEKIDDDRQYIYDPLEFIVIKEKVENKNIDYPIVSRMANGRKIEYVNADVNINSKIYINYDSSVIFQTDFEAEVTINGEIIRNGNSQKIEIPGYSEVGKLSISKYARVRSINNTIASFSNLKDIYKEIFEFEKFTTRELIYNPDEINQALKNAKEILKIDELVSQKNRLVSNQNDSVELEMAIKRSKDDQSKLIETITKIESELLKSNGIINDTTQIMMNDSLKKIKHCKDSVEEVVGKKNIQLDNTKQRMSEIQKNIKDLVGKDENIQRQQSAITEMIGNLQKLRNKILDKKCQIKLYTDHILNNENKVVIQIIAEKSKRIQNADLLGNLAQDIQDQMNILSNNEINFNIKEDSVRIVLKAFRLIKSDLEIVSELYDSGLKETIRKCLLNNLSPTEISLVNLGARSGDRISITIANKLNKSDNDSPRYVIRTFNFSVKSFGLNKKINDSFTLIKRLYTEKGIQKSINGTEITESRPKDVNFEPCAGTSVTWNYLPRNKFGQWLGFGFGINVSFLRFQTVETITTTDSLGRYSTKSEDRSNLIDIGSGVVFSLFDGTINLTLGANLTSGNGLNRAYMGIGFSFVNIAQKLGKTVEKE